MKALSHHIHVMMPPVMDRTEGGVLLPGGGAYKYFYGLVTSIGETVFARHLELGISDPIKVGDVVAFDAAGRQDLELSSFELSRTIDLHRTVIIRYPTVHTLISPEITELLDLYDFADEKESLVRGDGGRIEAAHSS